ncbi:hypothetical protein RI367_000339 [Sorochytrium milnesiophthora]
MARVVISLDSDDGQRVGSSSSSDGEATDDTLKHLSPPPASKPVSRASDSDKEQQTQELANTTEHPKKRAKVADSKRTAASDSDAAKSTRQRQLQEDKERTKAEKLQEKQRKAEERERLKQQKKESQRLEKERRQQFTNANKRHSRAEVVQEMIVDLDDRLTSRDGLAVSADDARAAFSELGCEVNITGLPYSQCVQWRRRVTRTFDSAQQLWVPLSDASVFIQTESSAVVRILSGERFATMAQDRTLADLDADVQRFKAAFVDQRCIYLVEGLEAWHRNQKARRNRKHREQVAQGEPPAATPSADLLVDTQWERVEDAIVHMQMAHHVEVVTTRDRADTLSTLVSYTGEIASLPCNRQMFVEHEHNFCTDIQLASGADETDTWKKMLLSISLCSLPVATAIVKRYPTVAALYDAYSSNPDSAPLLLENLEFRTTGGQVRRVGPAMSRKLLKIFTSGEPQMLVYDTFG